MFRPRTLSYLAAILAAWSAAAVAQDRTPVASDVVTDAQSDGLAAAIGPSPAGSLDCRPRTIARGEISHRRYGEAEYLGEDLIIRNPLAWAAFWNSHVGGIAPTPAPPPVNFAEQIVLAVIQGTQTSGGGPNITIAGIECGAGLCRIIVIDDETPGPLDVITNPFHFVAVDRRCLPCEQSISFTHVAPQPGAALVQGRIWSVEPNSDQPPRPLPGALVTLSAAASNTPQYSAISGLDGSYVIPNVVPRTYLARASREGYEPATAPLVVPPDSLVSRDFTLTHILPRGGVQGRTLLGGGPNTVPTPIAGVLVRAMRSGQVAGESTSGNDGRYGIGNLLAGEYTLVATKEGFQPAEVGVVIIAGQTIERNIFLTPIPPPTTGGVRGRTFESTGAGTATPLPGVLVRVLRQGAVLAQTTSNAEGRYELGNISPGECRLVGTKDGYLAAEMTIVIVAGQMLERNLVLQRAPAPNGNLTGVVAGIQDNISTPVPIAGAIVRIRRADSNQVIREAVTNNLGQYAVEGLPAGAYVGEASATGWQTLSRPFAIVGGQTTTLWFILQPQNP